MLEELTEDQQREIAIKEELDCIMNILSLHMSKESAAKITFHMLNLLLNLFRIIKNE